MTNEIGQIVTCYLCHEEFELTSIEKIFQDEIPFRTEDNKEEDDVIICGKCYENLFFIE